MADEIENENDRHPYEIAEERADELGLEGDERDDFIETRMKRAGYKRGPGAWISVDNDDDDDDSEHDDDDKPMTRGDWRRIQREQKKKRSQSYNPPPRNKMNKSEDGKKKASKRDPWW